MTWFPPDNESLNYTSHREVLKNIEKKTWVIWLSGGKSALVYKSGQGRDGARFSKVPRKVDTHRFQT